MRQQPAFISSYSACACLSHPVADLGEPRGAMTPGPALFVAEKGPRAWEKFKLSHRKTFEFSNKGPAVPKTATGHTLSSDRYFRNLRKDVLLKRNLTLLGSRRANVKPLSLRPSTVKTSPKWGASPKLLSIIKNRRAVAFKERDRKTARKMAENREPSMPTSPLQRTSCLGSHL